MANDKMLAALAPLKTELEEKRDAAEKALEPLRAEREAFVSQIQPLEAELQAVNKKIKDAEKELEVRDTGNQLAEIARVTGARSVRNG